MRRLLLLRQLLIVVAVEACASAGAVGGGPISRDRNSGLRMTIDSLVEAPPFRNAHWGILVVDPESGDTLYSRNAGKLFMPASNMKIVTGAVALALLGPDYRYSTTLVANGVVSGGVLHGDLVVHGRGDPTLSDHMRTDAMAPLREIADSLASHGIQRIAGRLLPGEDVFPDAEHGNGWSWDDFDEPYSAGVDELYFNEGFARIVVRAGSIAGEPVTVSTAPSARYPPVRVSAATVSADDTIAASEPGGPTSAAAPVLSVTRDTASDAVLVSGAMAAGTTVTRPLAQASPRAAFLAALEEALVSRGIVVSWSAVPPSAASDTLLVYRSPPLRQILPAMEKPSQNQIAELVLKTLGLELTAMGSADSGRRVVETQLTAWRAEPDGFVIRDGSGLSRYNYLTPETIVRTLDAIRRDTAFNVFYDALPIAGVDGTIAGRMRGTPAEGNVRAKTGYIAQARSLSGYVTASNGRLLIFSMMCNNWTTPQKAVNDVQDAIAVRLATLMKR